MFFFFLFVFCFVLALFCFSLVFKACMHRKLQRDISWASLAGTEECLGLEGEKAVTLHLTQTELAEKQFFVPLWDLDPGCCK